MSSDRKRMSDSGRNRGAQVQHRERVASDESPLAQARATVAETMRVVILRRWSFFVPFCLVSTLAALVSHQIPRKYAVTSMLERRENPVLNNLAAHRSMRLVKDSKFTVNRDLRQVDLMEEVLDETGLTDDLPRDVNGNLTGSGKKMRQSRAAHYAAGVSVKITSYNAETLVDNISITCGGRDPTHLATICNALRDVYIRRTRANMTQKLEELMSYFEKQAEQCQEQMKELNRARLSEDLRSIDFDVTNPRSIVNRINRLDNERDVLLQEREELDVRLEAYQENLERVRQLASRSVPTVASAEPDAEPVYRSPMSVQLQSSIAELDRKIYEERKSNKKTLKHPDVQELLGQRALLVQRLARQREVDAQVAPEQVPPPAPVSAPNDTWLAQIAELETEIKAMTNQKRRIEHSLDVVEADLKDYREVKAEIYDNYQKHEDVVEALRAVQQEYSAHRVTVAKLDSLLTADESERAVGFTVLREARPTLTPTNPKADIVLMVCLLLGVISGVCCVLLAEIFDQSFHTTRQASRALGLPVLECIDEIVTAADRARMFRRQVLFAPALVFGLLATATASNALAYLNLKRPHTYQRVLALPQELWQRATADGSETAGFDLPHYATVEEPTRPAARLASRARPRDPDGPTVTGRNLIEDFDTLLQRVGGYPSIPSPPSSH